jgi:hypothetical protein
VSRAPQAGLVPGLVVGAAAVAMRLAEGVAMGRWARSGTPLGAASTWLPWQLADNVRGGRSPFDASVFVEGPGTLWPVVGNPGLALLEAPLHLALAPGVASVTAVLLALVANAIAGGMYGATAGSAWLGALAASASWWALGFTGGVGAQVFLAAGLVAAAWAERRPRLAVGATAVGAFVAPLPTVAVLLGAGRWRLAALGAIGLLVAPLGTWGGAAAAVGDLGWLAGGASRALPLAMLVALAGLGAGGDRLAALAGLVAVAWGLTPGAVAGLTVALPWTPAAPPLAAGLAFLLAAALPLAGVALRAQGRAALAVLLAADLAGPLLVGGGALWAEAPPAPSAFAALAATPRLSAVYVLPEADAPDAGLALAPLHRQRLGRVPRLRGSAPPGMALGPEQVLFTLRQGDPHLVVLLTSPSAEERSAWATRLGPPRELFPAYAVWNWP